MAADTGQTGTPAARHWPRWILLGAPILAVVVSNIDIALLLLVDPHSAPGRLRIGLVATLPLSLLAAGWTYWLLVRAQREVDRRRKAEIELRAALDAREQALNREVSLRRELDHRVRNNLAGLMGLVALYEESGRSAAALAEALRGKLAALREVYAIINHTGSESIELHELVDSVTGGLVPEPLHASITFDGPRQRLTSAEASVLAMIVQELVTNSLKYGALSIGPSGRRELAPKVHVRWMAAPSESSTGLIFRWTESPVRPWDEASAIKRGVGLPLIEGFAKTDLRGGVSFSRRASEWVVEVHAQLKSAPCRPRTKDSLLEVCT